METSIKFVRTSPLFHALDVQRSHNIFFRQDQQSTVAHRDDPDRGNGYIVGVRCYRYRQWCPIPIALAEFGAPLPLI